MTLCLLLAALAALAALSVKTLLLRRSAREIARALDERLSRETNALIDIPSRDGAMRELAKGLNDQLAELRAQRRRFAQGDREIKEAVAALAHDLRTPLTAMSGYLSLLEAEPLTDGARRYVSAMRSRTDDMSRLSEELFLYAAQVSGRPLAAENVELRRALEDCLIAFSAQIEARGIAPDIRLPKTPVPRTLDGEALSRVLGNIVSNAVKYSDGDLRVTLTEEGEMTFVNRASALSGVDVGKLFDRFTTVYTGRDATGLGLAIARRLTERMGGAIGADYAEGELRIRVRFPSEAGK